MLMKRVQFSVWVGDSMPEALQHETTTFNSSVDHTPAICDAIYWEKSMIVYRDIA